jgi:hypothetical protein
MLLFRVGAGVGFAFVWWLGGVVSSDSALMWAWLSRSADSGGVDGGGGGGGGGAIGACGGAGAAFDETGAFVIPCSTDKVARALLAWQCYMASSSRHTGAL